MASHQRGRVVSKLRPEASESTKIKLRSGNWPRAEEAADEIIWRVRPNFASEERRRKITDYIEKILKDNLGLGVFPYGSVPLKTYLPNGDIDLAVFGFATTSDTLAAHVKYVFEQEARNKTAKFVVKDVQLIGTRVKVMRCMVQNTSIDVSFNQIGGLCSLCFLEQVDRLIGKHNLFKRSILLVKSWCYYESRTHGGNNGLISTYALTILTLHILQLFHSELNGPLAVLYKFLDYYGNFDWETYGISVNGPFRLSTLPAILVDMPGDCDGNLLLGRDILGSCLEVFSISAPCNDVLSHGFQQKHFNIVDPLNVANNLGHSVSKGNMFRILSAFKYGSKQLGSILLMPDKSIAFQLRKLFLNTIANHGNEHVDLLGAYTMSTSAVPRPHSNITTRDLRSNFCNLREVVASPSSSMLDLVGDLWSYFNRLQYVRWFIHSSLPIQSTQMIFSPAISCPTNNLESRHFFHHILHKVNSSTNIIIRCKPDQCKQRLRGKRY